MRIDEGETPAGFQILSGETFQVHRSADARLAEKLDMREAVRLPYVEAAEPGLANV